MIENNPTNVIAAFEMLLEEIETEIDFINSVGSKAFEKRDYDRAKEALEQAGKLTAFRDKMATLKKEWDSFTQIEMDEEDVEAAQIQRQNLGRLQRGMRTSEEAYYVPILQVLAEMGGSGKVAHVLDKVGVKMQSILKKWDYEPLSSSPDNPRWRNAAQWARNSMVNEGLLKNDSPRGVWEISEKGKTLLSSRK
ncbi:MAG TPA: winged helix-turn-helix domain-containing protein [Anaerohalosphaeraceae bacterium]|nr:winged helix-turn-helix domain-containing protein [Anaerohalosphaeraceae bacterium]HOM77306.1 winged helix-turn-helix domain-containing protein [Anaerohalosphaeraceae bacterium]HPC65411.1 winged helix-turn-helix domain-containing protein [Anaerohalosphaeraceae bacterium]